MHPLSRYAASPWKGDGAFAAERPLLGATGLGWGGLRDSALDDLFNGERDQDE